MAPKRKRTNPVVVDDDVQTTSATVAAAEVRYVQSKSAVELLAKDEAQRVLRAKCLVKDFENADKASQLDAENCRAEEAELSVRSLNSALREIKDKTADLEKSLNAERRELQQAVAQLQAMKEVSTDSDNLLTEKLALTREIAQMKPELEHLRTQNKTHDGILAEKLSLTSRVQDLEAELEDAKRNLARSKAKQNQNNQADEELKKELAELRKQVVNAESEDQGNAKELREEIKRLEKELSNEKRERRIAETQASKSTGEQDAEKAVLEDKLNQFRTKLRATKEKLKGTEEELQEARSAASRQPQRPNPRKRSAAQAQLDPDATMGTPGIAGKQPKRASSLAVGEKSNFSITPFFNRHTSVVSEDDSRDVPLPSIELEPPAVERAKTIAPNKAGVLANAPSSKLNSKPNTAARKKAAAPSRLELVVEEENASPAKASPKIVVIEETENLQTVTATSNLAQARPKTAKPQLKPKVFSSFPTFREASLPPVQIQAKKKRKLLGGPGKTLFDEEEEGEPATKAGQRAFGGFGGKGFGGLSLLKNSKGPLNVSVAQDGFTFSPLRRHGKAATDSAA